MPTSLGDGVFFLKFLQAYHSLGQIPNMFYDRFHDGFQDRQTPPSNSLKLVEFETITFYIDSLRVKLNLAPHALLK